MGKKTSIKPTGKPGQAQPIKSPNQPKKGGKK